MSPEDRAAMEEIHAWALINAPRPAAPEYKPGEEGYGPALCRNPDCEDEMPELRRALGHKFCTECQTAAEQRKKRGY